MLKLSHYILIKNVRAPPSLNSCGTKSLVKLGSCRPNFKITLEERPSEKSCSTSTFSREISLQIFSPTFLKRFPCKLSKPSKSSKLSKISRQQASQATQACQAHQASQAKQASLQARQANRIQTASQQLNREVTERVFSYQETRLVWRSTSSLTTTLLQTTTPRASHTGREGREGKEGRKGSLLGALNSLKIGYV